MSHVTSRPSLASLLTLVALALAACGPKGPPGWHGGMPPAAVSAPLAGAAARAEAAVTAAEVPLANAARSSKRLKPLFEAKAVSQKEYDDAVSTEEVAASDLKSARARLAEARLSQGYAKVESPISGLTSRALKSEGSLIAGPQDLRTTETQVHPIYVNFVLSESDH